MLAFDHLVLGQLVHPTMRTLQAEHQAALHLILRSLQLIPSNAVGSHATNLATNDVEHSLDEERRALFGQTNGGRYLTVVFTIRGTLVRVISARDMSRKERREYERTQAEE